MARSKASELLRPSLIDRLSEPVGMTRSVALEGISVRELKRSVARDLEWLLNTRVWLPPDAGELAELPEARRSILTYGIPDLSTFSWASPQDCQRIATIVEETIRTFEPRLQSRSVRCTILPSEGVADFSVKLRIEAILEVDPISELVTFDSAADFDGGGIRIESFE